MSSQERDAAYTNVPMPLHSGGICCHHGCYIGVVCPACHYERTKDLSPMGGGPNPWGTKPK